MKRKLLSIILCLAMALSLLPTAVLADETGATEDYVILELTYGSNVTAEQVAAAKAMYEGKKYETCKAANEAYMALYGVSWKARENGDPYLDVTDTTAPLYSYAADADAVTEVKYYIHGTLAGFTSLQSDGNNMDCTVGGNHQIPRTSISIIGVDDEEGNKAQLTDGNIQAYVAGGYSSKFRTSGKLTVDNIEFTSTTSTTVGASASLNEDPEMTVTSAKMEIKNCVFRGRLYVYDNFENEGAMTYNIHDNVFDGTSYSGDENAYSIFAQCRGGNELIIKDNNISGFARGINIDHANVKATIECNTISITDSGRACIQLSSLTTADIKGNTLNLTGGNAITLHEKLLSMTTAPEVSITGNTITGNGYLIYDDAAANGQSFTSDKLTLTMGTSENANTIASTVDTTKGVKGSKETALTGYVAAVAQGKDITGKVAQVGTEYYTTLDAALAALTAENHTLTLIDSSAWTYKNVYWSAGDQSGSEDTLRAAVEAAHQVSADSISIVCKPGETIAYSAAHIDVTKNITVYANSADFGGNDLSIGTYAAPKNSTTTINIYDAKNLVVWGQPVDDRDDVWNVNFTDCVNDGWNFLMYRDGESGKATINATLTGCKATGFKDSIIHTTADGSITIKNCEFANNCAPVNIAHKQTGTMTVTVENSTFTNCGEADMTKDLGRYAAPVRIVNNNATGTVTTEVTNCTFSGTVGNNGDILIGDGRDGKESNNVTLTVTNTNANVQAQQPGYYDSNGDITSTAMVSKTTVTESQTRTITNSVDAFKAADVDGVKYDTLQAATDAADGKTVKLLKNVTEAVTIPAGKTITLDLNGFTLVNSATAQNNTVAGRKHTITNNGTLTIEDSFGGGIVDNVSHGCAAIYNAGTITEIKGGKFTRSVDNSTDATSSKGNSWYVIYNAENATINKISSGEFLAVGKFSSLFCNSGTIDEISGGTFTQDGFIAFKNEGTVTKISGGTFSSAEQSCIQNWGTIGEVCGGTITAGSIGIWNLSSDHYTAPGKVGVISGGSISGTTAAIRLTDYDNTQDGGNTPSATYKASASITGGTITGALDVNENTKLVISGGTFSSAVDAKYCADGYVPKANSDGTYGVTRPSSSSSGSSSDPTYSVSTPSKTENGTVTVSPKSASKGDTVTITVKPDSGYVLDDLTVTDKNGNELKLTDKGNGKYTFTMPSGRVEVKASFAKEVETSPFADVATDAYYYEAVKWSVKNGITTGVGDNLFAPGQPCTRAQIVTFLWRAAGSPEPKGTAAGMTDVVTGSYYEKAVAWAIENGVTTGTTATTFSPDATCTRAQAVTFLARALNAKAASAAEFSDVPTDSYFAEAVAWAAANGVTEGVGNGLFAPDNDCTRGQIVTFLYRAYNK